MFWKLIRWGGTAVVVLLVLAAAFLSTQHDQTATPAQPADAQQQTNKNFNF
ncbi:hypothetical protein [Massilia mucilaginosa]|uniref:hypothetical protein n=1 Tax=Massilia mucilaginosa TaxID=2609282 RepID=UPI0014247C44|nr:hypothetical protein [Massilia mucilaginosa]